MSGKAKVKAKMEKDRSESSSDKDEQVSKSADGKGVKTSQKAADRAQAFGGPEVKTIVEDSILQISETIDDAHGKHKDRYSKNLTVRGK